MSVCGPHLSALMRHPKSKSTLHARPVFENPSFGTPTLFFSPTLLYSSKYTQYLCINPDIPFPLFLLQLCPRILQTFPHFSNCQQFPFTLPLLSTLPSPFVVQFSRAEPSRAERSNMPHRGKNRRRHRSDLEHPKKPTQPSNDSAPVRTSLSNKPRPPTNMPAGKKPTRLLQKPSFVPSASDQTAFPPSSTPKPPHLLSGPVTTSTTTTSTTTTTLSPIVATNPSLPALHTPTTPNSQTSEPSSTDGSRSIPYADVHTLARLLSSSARDRDSSHDFRQPHTIAFPPSRCKPFTLDGVNQTSQCPTSVLPSAGPSESTVSDSSCPDVLFRPISPVDGRNVHRAHSNATASDRPPRTVAKPVPIPASMAFTPPSPSPTSSPPISLKSQMSIFGPLPTLSSFREERSTLDAAPSSQRPTAYPHAQSLSGIASSTSKSNIGFSGVIRASPKRAYTTLSGSRLTSSVDSFPSSCNSTSYQSTSNTSSRQRSCFRPLDSARTMNEGSLSLSGNGSGRRISWHRAQAFDSNVDAVGSLDTLDPCVHRLNSTASDTTPLLVTSPTRRQRSDGTSFGRAFGGEGSRAASNHTAERHVAGIGLNSSRGTRALITRRDGRRDARRDGRRGSSYLTIGFLRRKTSVDSALDGLLPRSRGCTRRGRACVSASVNSAQLFDEDLTPVHAYTPLVPFGQGECSDGIVLYTNSVRAEINDLIFLCGLLQQCCGLNGDVRESEEMRRKHRNLEVDFELWFSRFAQYCGLMLFGMEEYVMRYITEVLAQRDVMLSRATADIEAEGMSHVQAWSRVSHRLFELMDTVRRLLGDVENRVMWLRRSRQFQDDLGRPDAWLETLSSVRRLIPGLVTLLDELDEHVCNVLSLRTDFRRGMKRLYRQFASLLTKEGSPPLGWSALITLTRWMADRKLRSDHVRCMSRAARLSLLSRYRADNSHHTIVRVHQTIAAEDRRSRFGFL